jgi:hypothetical protein
LEAFGITGVPVPLPGGTTGRCYRAGELVLKPDQDEQVVAWMAQLADTATDSAGFRLTQRVVSRSGRWTVSGWAATTFMEASTSTAAGPRCSGRARRCILLLGTYPDPIF